MNAIGKLLVVALWALTLLGCQPSPGGQGAPPAGTSIGGQYVGMMNGEQGTANVTFEKLKDYVSMAGTIVSPHASYTFSAQIVGDSGYGDITENNATTFRIKIDLTASGFNLTSNPLEGGGSSTYVFTKQ